MLYEVITNTGASFVNLDNWNERKTPELDARNIVGQIMGMGAGLNNGITIAFNPPAISGISMTGGFEVYLVITSYSIHYTKLYERPSSAPGMS